jgi:LPXTG-site transpeptidase (sortase) family protein
MEKISKTNRILPSVALARRVLALLLGFLALSIAAFAVFLLFFLKPAVDSGSISPTLMTELGGPYVFETTTDPVPATDLTNPGDNVPIYSGTPGSKISAPMHISIPQAIVDAPVRPVGLTKSGAMAVPSSPYIAGWYNHGVYPGDVGSAVIAGHSGYSGIHAAFDDLPRLRVGDLVYVSDKKGNSLKFRVLRTKLYNANAKIDIVFNRTGGHYLNLITCTGTWNSRLGTHSQRLVVFTELVS